MTSWYHDTNLSRYDDTVLEWWHGAHQGATMPPNRMQT